MTWDHVDLMALGAFRAHGGSTVGPTDVDFYLYFPTKAAAVAASGEIERSGYRTGVERVPVGRRPWLCLASRRMVLSAEAIQFARVGFELLAARLGGEFDGWGAAIGEEARPNGPPA
jgi:hypothetical protein